ncbi:MAG: divalent-cation tolerance protein CutA [Candidatus Binataceae bacterium]
MVAQARAVRVVLVMAGSEREAAKIARVLLEEKLAACVNILGPVRSTYHWQGAIESASEHLLMIKTRSRLYRRLERRVRELHDYEVPEILAFTPAAGSKPYLEWIFASTTPTTRKAASQ